MVASQGRGFMYLLGMQASFIWSALDAMWQFQYINEFGWA